jgi:hypothetical protein
MDNTYTLQDIMNKLFCTFTSHEGLEETLKTIQSHYSILYGKIFILEAKDSDELLCTYNIDPVNSNSKVILNTILLHRKKETNTLYTINALNLLIKELNKGVIDSNYKVEWLDFKNTVLLTQGSDLRKLETRINKIILV